MRTQYEAAARYRTAYYGQLARARLELGGTAVPTLPLEPVSEGGAELLRAAEILYAVGEHELVLSFLTDLADESSDAGTLAALGQLAAHNSDAKAMLILGKTALARGMAMDEYAFPQIGVPSYNPFAGSEIDRCIVYSIVRTRAPSISTTCRRQRRLDLCKSPRKPDATPPNVIASNTIGSGLCPTRCTIPRWASPSWPRC